MKGLLLKDFYVLLRVCWYFALFLVLWPLLLLAGEPPTVIVLSCFLGAMLPSTLIAYDERDKWFKYAETMPYTRGQIVTAKYIYGFIANGIVIVIAAFSMTANTLFIHTGNVLSFGDIILWCSIYLLAGAVVSFMMPFIFWFGAEKGRYAYMVFGGLCGGFAAIASSNGLLGDDFQMPRISSPIAYSAIMIVIAAVLYTVSWRLSVMLYRKREL